MSFKVGDKVRVRPLEARKYDGDCWCRLDMLLNSGKLATIVRYNENAHEPRFRLDIDDYWWYSPSMLEPVITDDMKKALENNKNFKKEYE